MYKNFLFQVRKWHSKSKVRRRNHTGSFLMFINMNIILLYEIHYQIDMKLHTMWEVHTSVLRITDLKEYKVKFCCYAHMFNNSYKYTLSTHIRLYYSILASCCWDFTIVLIFLDNFGAM